MLSPSHEEQDGLLTSPVNVTFLVLLFVTVEKMDNDRNCHWLTDYEVVSYYIIMKLTSLNISLPIEMKRFIEAKIACGYGTVSEYIRELIRADQKHEAEHKAVQEQVVAMLLRGIEQLERGETVEATPEFWRRKREELKQFGKKNRE